MIGQDGLVTKTELRNISWAEDHLAKLNQSEKKSFLQLSTREVKIFIQSEHFFLPSIVQLRSTKTTSPTLFGKLRKSEKAKTLYTSKHFVYQQN